MGKKSIDTNILLNFLVPGRNGGIAEYDFTEQTDYTIVYPMVVAEVVYVLTGFYGYERDTIRSLRDFFESGTGIKLMEKDTIYNALDIFAKSKLDFVDCYLLAKYEVENIEPFTFDKEVVKRFVKMSDSRKKV